MKNGLKADCRIIVELPAKKLKQISETERHELNKKITGFLVGKLKSKTVNVRWEDLKE